MEREFKLLKEGHPDAMEFIYARYRQKLFWMGKNLIKDEFVIENILQDTFLKLWEKRDHIEDPKHILFFLLYVMKRQCIYYYCRPRNRFHRNMNRLEFFPGYQEYMHGFDPESEDMHFQDQEADQKAFDRISRVFPLLSAERRRLIELCIKYGFQYKNIAQVMGTSITYTSNEVKRAIEDIKKIIHQGNDLETKPKQVVTVKLQGKMTEEQEKVLQLRNEKQYSFTAIAEELQLSQKEVHKEFMAAYRLLQEKHQQQQSA
ncbi:RNA polymerase sigma factor [Zunongwangia sp. HGR-M22]|uniref:RNA polymerase sigma factor n=1 Tax=Zunongwangia sp. HGR-M22 TaxID=3015168 RepID=UPI0022DD4D09|nr:sigma-70 family RNA polymerase sigma factor [Zunongwangia sp. HGR-M22]WBL25727.1 sigma-70 family RNA polymerase sigma factor [Zunongwangia sp. HGR-M22]